MAKQMGIIKLQGTIGDITFHKSKDGYIAKEKGGVAPGRIASDPAFQRTRENGAEFGEAGRAGKLLRTALRAQVQRAADSRMVSRLHKEMMRVVKADKTSSRGLRNVLDGELELLQGFDFNGAAKLGVTFYAPFTTSIDRATGECKVTVPPFVPMVMVAAPAGTTHFQLLSAAAAVDFTSGDYHVSNQESGILPLSEVATTLINHVHALPAASPHPLFLIVGIVFLQEVNGEPYALNNGAFNALSLVKVSGV